MTGQNRETLLSLLQLLFDDDSMAEIVRLIERSRLRFQTMINLFPNDIVPGSPEYENWRCDNPHEALVLDLNLKILREIQDLITIEVDKIADKPIPYPFLHDAKDAVEWEKLVADSSE